MKKVLSVLCMALLAGGMIFTSCTKNWTVTVKANNDAWGTVVGGGSYADGTEATLTATPKDGYSFVTWDDGVKDNPRKVTVTANVTYTAIFEAIPAGPSVKVTFNNGVWDAGSISTRWYTQAEVWDVYSMQTEGNLPIADVATSIVSGSSSATASSENGSLGGDFNWVEYYNETYLQDQEGTYYGDYWGKNVTCTVSAFDATALTLSANLNGTMFSAYEAFIDETGVDAASTAPMTVNMTNVKLQAAKGMPAKKVAGKLVAVK
ncbi:MAG: hypothetical protein J6X51_01900 [Bacteroidales bacterium]|nr:hypothetical protein [Bacteroidales bacterium]